MVAELAPGCFRVELRAERLGHGDQGLAVALAESSTAGSKPAETGQRAAEGARQLLRTTVLIESRSDSVAR